MKDNTNRIIEIDFLKVLAIGYIVYIHHLSDYLSGSYTPKINNFFGLISLALFVYLSGYLLSQKHAYLNNAQDIWHFYKKRFLRIYPLYVLALVLFLFCSLANIEQFIWNVLLLNMFLKKSVPTLWFVSLICFYYLLFPVFIYRYSLFRLLITSFFVYMILVVLSLFSNFIDIRLITYLPLFVLGIITTKHQVLMDILKKVRATVPSVVICGISAYTYYYFHNYRFKHIFLLIFMLSSIFPLFSLGQKVAAKFKYKDILVKLSYASFCMYLFHRIVFTLMLKIYYPKSDIIIICYLAIIGVSVTYFVSIKTQTWYDSVFSRNNPIFISRWLKR